jgi:3-isopropylmalate/(R)-2-methylmalate dehydratase large subunit
MEADSKVLKWVSEHSRREPKPVKADLDAKYAAVKNYDVSALAPQVAKPHAVDNVADVTELSGVKIDRSYIGSCTGGKITDFLAAAMVLKGRKVVAETFIVPATVEVDADLSRRRIDGKTLREIFLAAGCKVGPASCAACLGGPADTFGRAERPLTVISTTNRNFPGRMGHKDAAIYLASPLTAAASALTGHITDPREVVDLDRPVGTIAATE